MQFGKPYSTAPKTHFGYSFQLSPATLSIRSSQSRNVSNFVADSDDFNIADFADDFEVHQRSIKSAVLTRFKEDTERLS